jgi:hypothetical protein
VKTFVVRVWLPDRPGALGAVASRIGAVRGDVVGIEILERGAGRAVDELIVELPDESLLALLVAEIAQVDGVDVEDVRPAAPGAGDPRRDALETAGALLAARDGAALVAALVRHVAHDFDADWCAVVDTGRAAVLAASGDHPGAEWLSAFVAGVRSSATGDGADDVGWADLPAGHAALVVGRGARPLRARERRHLGALAVIADHRWGEVGVGALGVAG